MTHAKGPLKMPGRLSQSKLAYEEDRLHLRTGVMLPNALELRYPTAGTQWGWFWVFPSDHESTDPRSGIELAALSGVTDSL